MLMDERRMTGITAQDFAAKKDPATPPPEYVAEQVPEKVAPCADAVTAAIPLLYNVSQTGENEKDRPPRYIESFEENVPHKERQGDEEETPADPWEMPVLADTGPSWTELDNCGRVRQVVVGYIGKFLALLALLYLFICSLDFLSSSFRLVGGKAAGEAFRSSELLQNPVAGLMIGILATVLVQSSSTSTSIVVTMVASGIMDVRPAIPIVMGANIGTSVTNTIVSMAQATDRNQFRRAFAGATVHDMFNWLSVIILLPLEVATGYLYHATSAATKVYNLGSGTHSSQKDLLKTITKPFTSLVIQLDKKVIEGIALGKEGYASKSLIKKWCQYEETVGLANVTTVVNQTDGFNGTELVNMTAVANQTVKVPVQPCSFLFHDTGMSDALVGFLLLTISLIILCSCLVLMVKLLHSMLRGRIAVVIKKTINSNFPGCLSYFTGYVAMLIGAGMTILVQSSSVFTSAMTPLVGLGVVNIERMYPLTLGSNIGTTATGLLAALAAPGDKLAAALQIALCHLFFNISGILLFYPVPFMRFPIQMAKVMGNTTAKYRWFAIFYLIMMFFVLPATVFLLSMAGIIPLGVVLGLAAVLIVTVLIVRFLQEKHPNVLPGRLRNWEFLPECLHSLDPLDRVIVKVMSLFRKVCPCGGLKAKKPSVAVILTASTPQESESLTAVVDIEMADSAASSQNTSPAGSQNTSPAGSQNTSPASSQNTSPASSQNTSPASSQNTSPAGSQNTSACSSRSTSYLILPRTSVV